MADVEEQIRELQARVSHAQSQRAKAEFQRDSAQAAAELARQRLRDEFGIETPDDAKRVQSELETGLARSIAEAQEALERTT